MYQVNVINSELAITRRLVKSSNRDYVMQRIASYLDWLGVEDIQYAGHTNDIHKMTYMHPINNTMGIIQVIKS